MFCRPWIMSSYNRPPSGWLAAALRPCLARIGAVARARPQRHVRRRVRARRAGLSRHADAGHRSRSRLLAADPGQPGGRGRRAIRVEQSVQRRHCYHLRQHEPWSACVQSAMTNATSLSVHPSVGAETCGCPNSTSTAIVTGSYGTPPNCTGTAAPTAAARATTSRSSANRSPTPRSCRTRSSAARRRCPRKRSCACNSEMSATMQLPIMHRISRRLRALVRDRRASTAVEFALAAPALFLFMFGIIECGYALWMQNALDYSVAAAARCASLERSACTGSPSLVTTYAASESGASLTPRPSPTRAPPPAAVR